MTDLIRLEKDGVVIDVHPDALMEHKKLHWNEAPEAINPAERLDLPTNDYPDADVEEATKRGPGRPRKMV